jgi:Tfp pilus assembly protein PilO
MNSHHRTISPPKPSQRRPWWLSIAIMGIIDVLFIIASFLLLGRIAAIANSIYKLNGEKIVAEQKSNAGLVKQEIENHKEDADKLFSLFPSNDKLLEIIDQMDQLKRDGLIAQYTFVSDTPVKDKSGYQGLPIMFDITGSVEGINNALKKINDLPFILRDIKMEIKELPKAAGYTVKYGVILYVDEKFDKN